MNILSEFEGCETDACSPYLFRKVTLSRYPWRRIERRDMLVRMPPGWEMKTEQGVCPLLGHSAIKKSHESVTLRFG